MKYIGVNKGKSQSNKELHDGGLVLVENGKIVNAYMEERLSRKLRKGGYEECFAHLQDINDIKCIGISTCTEPLQYSELSSYIKGIKHINVDHHISHALCAFELSGFSESLVAVMDGGGNTLDEISDKWWENERQQNSYYFINNDNIELLDSDFTEAYEMGYGELYRAMTYLLGFNTSKKSAHITALASYGDYRRVSEKPFIIFENGKLKTSCKYNYEYPEKSLEGIWKVIGYSYEKVLDGQELTQDYCDLCAYIQWNVEQSLIKKLHYLKNKYNIGNLCLSGGVALNCVLSAKIQEQNLFQNVYVPFCAGDHGQAMGNVFYVMRQEKVEIDKNGITPYLGTDVNGVKFDEIVKKQPQYIQQQEFFVIYLNDRDLQELMAEMLLKDMTFFVCRGKSEHGLRALGNRSIISRSDTQKSYQTAIAIKQREWFRPFAPMVLEEFTECLVGKRVSSPYMTTAYQIQMKEPIRYCCSVDGRARLQTVSDDSFWGAVLKKLKSKGVFPSCLNTSLNLKGEPIVETSDDALQIFGKSEVNSMVLGNFVLFKHWSMNSLFDIGFDVEIKSKNKNILCKKQDMNIAKCIEIIRKETGISKIYFRKYFSLNCEYLQWLANGKKNTTIRYKKHYLELPYGNILNMWSSKNFENIDFNDSHLGKENCRVCIEKIIYKRFGDLNTQDAINDGFGNVEEMKSAFRINMYPGLTDDEWVSIYCLKIIPQER